MKRIHLRDLLLADSMWLSQRFYISKSIKVELGHEERYVLRSNLKFFLNTMGITRRDIFGHKGLTLYDGRS